MPEGEIIIGCAEAKKRKLPPFRARYAYSESEIVDDPVKHYLDNIPEDDGRRLRKIQSCCKYGSKPFGSFKNRHCPRHCQINRAIRIANG